MKLSCPSLVFLALSAPLGAQTLAADDPSGLHDLFGRLLFSETSPATGGEPWSATFEGAQILADINPGAEHGLFTGDPELPGPAALEGVALGGELFFFAYLANDHIALCKSDGTSAGTEVLNEFQQTGSTFLYGYSFRGVALDERVVFTAYLPSTGWSVWSSNGNVSGLRLLLSGPSLAYGYSRVGNEALFFGNGRLWKTDGTEAGTSQVYLFTDSTDTSSLAVLNGELYFVARDADGDELWKSDGTAAGTGKVADVNPGPGDSDPDDLTVAGDFLYFTADDGDGDGRDLFRTDGTAAGTTTAFELQWGYEEGPRHLTALGDRLFFAHGYSGSKDQLYLYDHPVATLVHEFVGTGGLPDGVAEIEAVGSRRVFLQAYTVGQGRELWVSDGTAAGTQLFDDVLAGSNWSSPHELTLSDGRLFFSADVSPAVEKLHYREVGATAQSIGVGCAATGVLPRLGADDPVIGGSSELRIEDGAPGAAAFVSFGSPAAPWGLGSGCRGYIDPAGLAPLASAVLDPSGAWTSGPIPLPATPTLEGIQLVLQAVVGPTSTQPLGVDFSNGVLLTFGS